MRKHVLIIPDGAADKNHDKGGSPLEVAVTPNMDFVAREGLCGIVRTLYQDLPQESMVAQLGMLGWDPRVYYPFGRASSELMATAGVHLNRGDIAFRANLVCFKNRRLESYNAKYISSQNAQPLVEKITSQAANTFPEFELYHQLDFRNTLVFRNAGTDPRLLICPEPHESEGKEFDPRRLVKAECRQAAAAAARVNEYMTAVARILRYDAANALFPWSPSGVFGLPSFRETTGFQGKTAIVGCLDFLNGIAKAGEIEFFRVGNARPDTDYRGKGLKIVELLGRDYGLVVCHINGPDEASHMNDLESKIRSLECIDEYIVRPVVEYFKGDMSELGGVMIVPDHYSNTVGSNTSRKRSATHSLDPVPFAIWNDCDRDTCNAFNESGVTRGRYGRSLMSHLDLLPLLLTPMSAQMSARL